MKIFKSKHPLYIFISRFPPPYGGVSNQVKWLGEYLVENSKNKLSIVVIDLKTLTIHACEGNGWSSYQLYKLPFFYLSFIRALPNFFVEIFKNIEFIFKTDGYIFWRISLIAFAKTVFKAFSNSNVKLIYSFHFGSPSLVGGQLASQWKLRHITAIFGEAYTNYKKLYSQKSFLLRNCDQFVSCSNHCGEMMRDFDKNINFDTLYYGTQLQELDNLRTKVISTDSSRKKTIMFLGRIDPEMGIRYFISVAKILYEKSNKSYSFVVCGQNGSEIEFVNDNKHFFNGDLSVHISVPFQTRNNLLASSDILIVPSTNDRACFGLAIVEGLAAGCSIYARDIGGHREPLLNEDAFLFHKDTEPKQLASKIINDESNKSLQDTKELLRLRVLKKFELQECLMRQKKYINRLLSQDNI